MADNGILFTKNIVKCKTKIIVENQSLGNQKTLKFNKKLKFCA